MRAVNYLVAFAILAMSIGIIIYLIFYNGEDIEESENDEKNKYDFYHICNAVDEIINEMCNMNILLLNLSYKDAKKRKRIKAQLKIAIRSCANGERGKREYVKEYIKDILVNRLSFKDDETIERCIPYSNPDLLSCEDKFNILLYKYEQRYQDNAVDMLFEKYKWGIPKHGIDGDYYEITEKDVNDAYASENVSLTYLEKLDCFSQKVFQTKKGNGCIDQLRNMQIDSVSGGVGGIPEKIYDYMNEIRLTQQNMKSSIKSYEYIACMYHGKTIHISALSFKSEKELERVTKNIYRYGSCGHLSMNKGYIINDLPDGSRITVGRPPYSESWFFICRRHNVGGLGITDLINLPGYEDVIELLFLMVRGENDISITGDAGCGKTTLLRLLVAFLKATANIRSLELVFETHLNETYPTRDIISFRQTDTISAQEALDMMKKVDCEVAILGEVAEAAVAALAIQLSQTNTKMTMHTGHEKTTHALIEYFADALVSTGSCSDQHTAERKASEAINFDVHMVLIDGERYLQRITEIIPYEYVDAKDDDEKLYTNYLKVNSRQKPYYTKDIVVVEDGKFVIKNRISKNRENEMLERLTPDTRKRYYDFWKRVGLEEQREVI